MGLTGALLRAGARRPDVLAAVMPGGTPVRLAVEEQLRHRGWPAAMTPADADVLLTAGEVTPGLADVLCEIWRAMPAPRARVHAIRPGDVRAALDAASAALGDRARQPLPEAPNGSADSIRHHHAHTGHGAAGPSDAGHEHHRGGGIHHGTGTGTGEQAHQGHDMGGEAQQGHDMGGMAMPAGLPMTDRGEDRDGLKLDQLHVPLGPVLPDWPTGLVVQLILHGDVVQHEALALGADGNPGESFWTEPWRRAAAGEPVTTGQAARRRAGAHLDSLGRFLTVTGWQDAAVTARRLRDSALAGAASSRLQQDTHRFTRRVGRSRTLGWLTRGLGNLRADQAASAGVGGPALRAAGDVTTRYRRWCSDLVDVVARLDDDSPLDPVVLEPARGPWGRRGAVRGTTCRATRAAGRC